MLTYQNNDPYIEGTSLYDLVKVCQTPFYVYSQQKIINQVNKTKEILGNNIFYSIKSNSNQAILKLMNSLDIGADVIATGHNLDDTLQTFVINMLSGDTTKVGWMNPDTSTNSLRKIN